MVMKSCDGENGYCLPEVKLEALEGVWWWRMSEAMGMEVEVRQRGGTTRSL